MKVLPLAMSSSVPCPGVDGLLLEVAVVADLKVLCVHGQNLPHGRRGISEILDRYAVAKIGLIFYVWSS